MKNIHYIYFLLIIQFIAIIVLAILLKNKNPSSEVTEKSLAWNGKWFTLDQKWLAEYKLKTLHAHQKKMKDLIFDMGMKLPKNPVFVDSGAHIGDTGLFLQTKWNKNGRNDIKVISIEPDESKAEFIRKMAEVEKVKIDVVNSGLWDKTTRGDIGKHNNYSAMWTVKENPAGSIELRTLDDILDGSRLDILQLDVEGSEPQALRGAEKTITKFHPAIIIEIEFNEAKKKTSNEAISILKSWGYKQSGERMENDLLFLHPGK
jgi:FkbM family methyltransferase